MPARRLLILPAAIAVALLTGCVGDNAQPAGGELPDPIDDEAVLVVLEDIAPGLGDESSIDDADAICADIDNGEDSEAIDEHALELFADQATEEFTLEQAQQAVQYILTEYCG